MDRAQRRENNARKSGVAVIHLLFLDAALLVDLVLILVIPVQPAAIAQ